VRHPTIGSTFMIFGTRMRKFHILIVFFFLPLSASNVEAIPLNLEAIFSQLAEHSEDQVAFTEIKKMPALKSPLKLKGYLIFKKPDYLEKRTQVPSEQEYIIEGSNVRIMIPGKETISLPLNEYPLLAAFATSLRAPLSGDIQSLYKYFSVHLGGSMKHWLLILTPIDPELSGFVRAIRLNGHDGILESLQMEEPDGSTSTMFITPP